jgi:hypothetical protein
MRRRAGLRGLYYRFRHPALHLRRHQRIARSYPVRYNLYNLNARYHCYFFSCPNPAACNVAASIVRARVERMLPSSMRMRPAMVQPPGAVPSRRRDPVT